MEFRKPVWWSIHKNCCNGIISDDNTLCAIGYFLRQKTFSAKFLYFCSQALAFDTFLDNLKFLQKNAKFLSTRLWVLVLDMSFMNIWVYEAHYRQRTTIIDDFEQRHKVCNRNKPECLRRYMTIHCRSSNIAASLTSEPNWQPTEWTEHGEPNQKRGKTQQSDIKLWRLYFGMVWHNFPRLYYIPFPGLWVDVTPKNFLGFMFSFFFKFYEEENTVTSRHFTNQCKRLISYTNYTIKVWRTTFSSS